MQFPDLCFIFKSPLQSQMDLTKIKPFLKSFWQIISIVKIFVLQALSLYFLSYCCGLLVEAAGVRGCPAKPEALDWSLGLILMVSLGIGFLSLHPIVFPQVWHQEIAKEVSFSFTGLRYNFFSTHPSYILLDFLLLIPAFMFFWNGQSETLCEFNFAWGQGWAALFIGLFFPTLRLICWFVLGQKIYAMKVSNVWMGIAWWYIVAVPFIVFISYAYANSYIFPRLRLPVVDAQTFAGGYDKHPEFHGQLVRVRGVLKRGIAKCGLFGSKEKTDYPFGTVLLDMGKGNGEVFVQARKPYAVIVLENEAQNKQGQVFEAFGRLSKLPNPDKKMVCGIEKILDDIPKGGRALLEIETPQ